MLPGAGRGLAERGAALGGQQRAGFVVAAFGVCGSAFEQRDGQAAAGDGLLADALGGRQVDAGLDLVGQSDDRRAGARLDDRSQCRRAGGEVGEGPRFVAGRLRYRMHANPHAGDDAEGALRADDQLTQVGTGRRCGRTAQVEDAGRGDDRQAAHHVVEPAVARGVLPRRPRCGEPADGGEFEALREVAEGKAFRTKEFLGLRAGDAGFEFGFAGLLVDGDQPVQAA